MIVTYLFMGMTVLYQEKKKAHKNEDDAIT